MFFEVLLLAHSWLRWIVLAVGLLAVVRSALALKSGQELEPSTRSLHLTYMISLDLQVLIGFLLYFVFSPVVRGAFEGSAGGGIMKDPTLRYWVVEHVTMMLLALVVLHVGRAKSKKLLPGRSGLKWLTVSAAISLLLLLAAMPWPFLQHGRPLFRF